MPLKNLLLTLVLFLLFAPASIVSQNVVLEFEVSKTHCLFNFLQSISGRGEETVLLEFFNKSKFYNSDTKSIITEFNALPSYSYQLEGYPAYRYSYIDVWDLVEIASANAKDLNDFKRLTIGLLSVDDHSRFFNLLERLLPIYNELLWNPYYSRLQLQKATYEGYWKSKSNSDYFYKLMNFYGTIWPAGVPFKVSLYPIPASGSLVATPVGNTISCGVYTKSIKLDTAEDLGIVFHELCHILYRSQRRELQHTLEDYFTKSNLKSALYAYGFFDEALATTAGNGWVYEKLSGHIDSSFWYNHPYINAFSKGIFPLMKSYLDGAKKIDHEFVNGSIDMFQKLFPSANLDYENLFFTRFVLVEGDHQFVSSILSRYFQSYLSYSASPITSVDNIYASRNSKFSKMFVILENHKSAQEYIKNYFPAFKTFNFPAGNSEDYLVTLLDEKDNAYIVINASHQAKLPKILQVLKENKRVDPRQNVIYIR